MKTVVLSVASQASGPSQVFSCLRLPLSPMNFLWQGRGAQGPLFPLKPGRRHVCIVLLHSGDCRRHVSLSSSTQLTAGDMSPLSFSTQLTAALFAPGDPFQNDPFAEQQTAATGKVWLSCVPDNAQSIQILET